MLPDFPFPCEDEVIGSVMNMTYSLGYFSNGEAHCKYRVPRPPSIVPTFSSSGIFLIYASFIPDWAILCPTHEF